MQENQKSAPARQYNRARTPLRCGMRHGPGALTSADGFRVEGEWRLGRFPTQSAWR